MTEVNYEEFDRPEKQKALLETMISAPDVYTACESIIHQDYFDPRYRNAVAFIKEYYSEHGVVPDFYQINTEVKKEKLEKRETTPDKNEWAKINIERFCQYRGVVHAIQKNIDGLGKGEFGKLYADLEQANEIAIEKDIGYDYFDPEEIQKRIDRFKDNPPIISTGWKSVDDVLNGGIARQELLLFAGIAGVGKSFTLANLGLNFLEQGYNVVFLTLELSADRCGQRFDQMFTGIGGQEWEHRTDEVTKELNIIGKEQKGSLTVHKMSSGTNGNEMRNYIKQYYSKKGFYPDLFIVDYLDKMSPTVFVAADNVAERDRLITIDLRDLGIDYNMCTATASQLNREAIESMESTQAHIAGGMGKIREADAVIFILMDNRQKMQGKMEFRFVKTRNSEGIDKPLLMAWVREFVRIRDGDYDGSKSKPKALNFNASGNKGKKESKSDTSTDQTTDDLFGDIDRRIPNI